MSISREAVLERLHAAILRAPNEEARQQLRVVVCEIDTMKLEPHPLDVPFHMQDRSRCLVVGAQNHIMARFSDAHNAAEFARSRPGYEHAKAYVSLADAPVKELEGTVPVVLYFANQSDADEFTLLVQQAKPGLVARQL